MEFLLRSQKRNRRRLIIEQLILLLLRILLVLLAAFLVARFLFAGTGTKGATHIAIIDDTLSMADLAREAGKESTPYGVGIEQLKEVVKKAQQAPSAQMLRVYLLSELDKAPLYDARINNRTNDDLDTAFVTRARKPSFLHTDPAEGIKKAVALLEDVKDGSKILHFVSDFRDKDWPPDPTATRSSAS